MKKIILLIIGIMTVVGLRAEIAVSDVEVFSGYPWKEVVVAYTITGTDVNADAIRLAAKPANKSYSYTAKTLSGATLIEGRHIMRWNAAAENVKLPSSKVVFTVSVVNHSVQLWENGPYWAECNVGARNPEEYGYYFWWGDAVGYERNVLDNGWVSVADGSSHSSSSCPTSGKSKSELQSLGYIDSTGNLVAKCDAATAHLGAPWRMPTDAEFSALISKCDTTWTTRNGVYGRLVTGRGTYAKKSIFLPAAGAGNGSYFLNAGSTGSYWSSTLDSDNSTQARRLAFNESNFRGDNLNRNLVLPVRPVRGFAQ